MCPLHTNEHPLITVTLSRKVYGSNSPPTPSNFGHLITSMTNQVFTPGKAVSRQTRTLPHRTLLCQCDLHDLL